MKHFTDSLILFLVACLCLSACSGSDDVSYAGSSSDCYISAFTLGQLRRTVHTTSSTGQDSTYTISFSGSLYPMAIDQRQQTITNSEPLPMNTRLSAVVVSITAQGTVFYAPTPLTESTEWKAYATTDSIDFTTPVAFRVYANDGKGTYRQYTASMSLRQNEAGSFAWKQEAALPELEGRPSVKLLNFNGQLAVLSTDADGRLHYAQEPWTDRFCTGAEGGDISSVQVFDEQLWMTTREGLLLSSADGIAWAEVPQEEEQSLRLLAASDVALYACAPATKEEAMWRQLYSLDGTEWYPLGMEASERFTTCLTSVAYLQDNGNSRILMAAPPTEAADTTLYVWSLLEIVDEAWICFTNRPLNAYQLPCRTPLSIVSYNGWLVALMPDAALISYDNGITWKKNSYLTLPEAVAEAGGIKAAASLGEYIWTLAGNQLWRVRYANYGK